MLLSVPGKVFARIILDRVCHHLLEHRCPEQSGFTPKRSTIDRILALWVLTECRREFRQGLLAAYVDLCKAFDSVNQNALWRIFDLRGASICVSSLRWVSNWASHLLTLIGGRERSHSVLGKE